MPADPPGSATSAFDVVGTATQVVEWLYDHVFASMSGGDPPGRLLTEAEIDSAVTKACAAAGISGFVTGLGGLITLPIALPANLVSVLAVHLLLVKRIAAGRGYDLGDEKVRSLVTACLVGNTTLQSVKEAGVRYGMRSSQTLLTRAAGSAAGLTKALPVVGGLVGGTIDALATRAVAAVAKRVFERIGPSVPPPGPRDGPIIDGVLVS